MDFHCLARKDLQALCKMNKIPANRTNVAMAEALSSLNIVKGIEKYCKSTESSAAESSVESPEKNVVTSPKTIGRRKQVTATPVTRRNKRVSSVKTVQRVYNTRLSAKLLKKEKVDSEKKECLEALKFNSYSEVVSDFDLGEVLEDKTVPGCHNVGVDSSMPEIEQQNVSVLWENATKDLDMKDTSATGMKSEVLEINDEGFQNFEMPIHNKMAVLDVPDYQKKDDVGVGLTLSETDAEVIPNEGSDYMGTDFPFYEIEQLSESPNSKYADRDLDLKHTAAENMNCKPLENSVEGFQILGMPSCNNMVIVDVPHYQKKVEVFSVDADKVETPTSEIKAAVPILSLQEKRSVDVGFSFLKNGVQSGNSKRKNSENARIAAFDMKAGDWNSKGSDDLVVKFHLSEIEQPTESPNSKYADKKLDFNDTDGTDLKSKVLINKGSGNVEGDSSVLDIGQQSQSLKWKSSIEYLDSKEIAAKNLESNVLKKKVEGFKIDAVDVLEETPSHNHIAVVDPLHHKKKDDVVDLSVHETEITTEVPASEVELLAKGTEKAEVETSIQKGQVGEQVLSPQKKDSFQGSDDVGVHFTFSDGSDDVKLHLYVLEADKNVGDAVTFSSDSNERESRKEHLNMESSGKVDFGEGVYNLTIQPKSEKVMLECSSSGTNNFLDGENLDNSVKILEDITCNLESGAVYDDVKGLASMEEISGKAIASGPPIGSESSERLENSIHNNSDDDTSTDTVFFQHNAYSKQSDSSRKSSEIFSCDGAFKYADQLEMKGSIKATNDFSGRVLSVNELGDEDSFADDPESNSKTFDNSFCDTEAESYFLEYVISSKQQDRKRESTASQILDSSCTREPADQSEMPESFDSSIGYSSEIASSHHLVSANSITKGSRLPVASDLSSCCSGIKKLRFDVNQKASEAKSPNTLKLSEQMQPSSAPASLQFRRSKIHLMEQPLLLADHPFTKKVLSSSVRSSGPCQSADMSNYMPLSSATRGPISKVESNVSDNKENVEQNEIWMKITQEKACNSKNAVVSESHEI